MRWERELLCGSRRVTCSTHRVPPAGRMERLRNCAARALILNIQCHAKAGEIENRVREAHVLEIVPVVRQTEM